MKFFKKIGDGLRAVGRGLKKAARFVGRGLKKAAAAVGLGAACAGVCIVIAAIAVGVVALCLIGRVVSQAVRTICKVAEMWEEAPLVFSAGGLVLGGPLWCAGILLAQVLMGFGGIHLVQKESYVG